MTSSTQADEIVPIKRPDWAMSRTVDVGFPKLEQETYDSGAS